MLQIFQIKLKYGFIVSHVPSYEEKIDITSIFLIVKQGGKWWLIDS
jgi:hypothetical protein